MGASVCVCAGVFVTLKIVLAFLDALYFVHPSPTTSSHQLPLLHQRHSQVTETHPASATRVSDFDALAMTPGHSPQRNHLQW